MSATAVQSDTVWLQALNYRVMPLKAHLTEKASELKPALQSGLAAYPDGNRRDFYDVKLSNGWAYIHVLEDIRTVYLVAYTLAANHANAG